MRTRMHPCYEHIYQFCTSTKKDQLHIFFAKHSQTKKVQSRKERIFVITIQDQEQRVGFPSDLANVTIRSMSSRGELKGMPCQLF